MLPLAQTIAGWLFGPKHLGVGLTIDDHTNAAKMWVTKSVASRGCTQPWILHNNGPKMCLTDTENNWKGQSRSIPSVGTNETMTRARPVPFIHQLVLEPFDVRGRACPPRAWKHSDVSSTGHGCSVGKNWAANHWALFLAIVANVSTSCSSGRSTVRSDEHYGDTFSLGEGLVP
jgi:hypothetical protein